MNNYKVGDRVWWHGCKLKVIKKSDRFYVYVDGDKVHGAIFKRFVKPILRVKNGVVCE